MAVVLFIILLKNVDSRVEIHGKKCRRLTVTDACGGLGAVLLQY
jgi:hypothetical protein